MRWPRSFSRWAGCRVPLREVAQPSGATAKAIAWWTRLPSATIAELEGAPEWIDRAAARLGVDRADYITLSYGRLFDKWREQHHPRAEDLTFAAVAQAGTAR